MRFTLSFITLATFLLSCSKPNNSSSPKVGIKRIQNLEVASDFADNQIQLSLDSAYVNGITIPDNHTYIHLSFEVHNPGRADVDYYYKVVYQNESYKVREFVTDSYKKKIPNPAAVHNFYGSWHDASGFRPLGTVKQKQTLAVKDSFRVVGNPLNLQDYFGENITPVSYTEERLEEFINRIRSTPEWYKQVQEKARQQGIALEKQLKKDALWAIDFERGNEPVNNRWKQNPRMGNYSVMVILTTAESLEKLPEYAVDLSKPDPNTNARVNPYFYYSHADHKLLDLWSVKNDSAFSAQLTFNGEPGLYRKEEDSSRCRGSNTLSYCNASDALYVNALFEPYAHDPVGDFRLNNIPVAYDVTGEGYTRQQYRENASAFSDDQRVQSEVGFEKCGCRSVDYNPEGEFISLINRGSAEQLQKQNSGIKGRIGLTYGKYTAKVRFPKIVSPHRVWNGLTCAFWLLNQGDEQWNQRSSCDQVGYRPKSGGERKTQVAYSEIDIEILKTSPYWPQTSYGPSTPYPPGQESFEDEIMVAATNWDMACNDPSSPIIGAQSRSFNNELYTYHRWDYDYQALTAKTMTPHDGMMGEIYYYQIDWQPHKIIYRMGPSKEQLRTFCVMDTSMTTIPDNQMVPVVSQEFHNTAWWGIPAFEQNDIPFPLRDIKGEVYEITVE